MNNNVPFGIAGMTAGFSIAERAFPGVGFDKAGQASSKFIAPSVNITVGGYLVNELKSIKRRSKK